MVDNNFKIELRKRGSKTPLKTKEVNDGYPPKEIFDDKKKRISDYRKEVSRKAAIINKRIERLERNNLTDTPAYKQYKQMTGGNHKFGVKGKSYNEVQSELAKINKLLDAKTSTVRGSNKVLKEIAENTGIKYKNLSDLKQKSAKFFELSSKVEQYLRNVEDAASAIGYQKIWEAVAQYTKQIENEFDLSNMDVDDLVETISNAILESDDGMPEINNMAWYLVEK